jgi:hypothetical protein
LDIIAIIFFTYWIGPKARAKGQPVLRWRWFVVLTWVTFEIIGGMIGLMISKNFILASLLGFACGFGGYLLAKYRLDQLPDLSKKDEHWMDRMGKDDRG